MRYAVICAFNPRNYGMYSVDLAAYHVFSKLGLDFDLCLFEGKGTKIGRLGFRRIQDVAELREYGAIVYWGDFQNNPMWGGNDFSPRYLKKTGAASHSEAFEQWRDLYLRLHRKLPETTKFYSIGGCFLGMGGLMRQPDIRAEFAEFVDRSDGLVVRDTMSLEQIRQFAPDRIEKPLSGFDVASLLEPVTARSSTGRGYFVYAFGRTLTPDNGHQLARRLGERLGLKPVCIDWFVERWPRRISHWSFNKKLAALAGAAFAVTDIYHFAINCLVQGTLPICLADPESQGDSTVADLKKTVLYRMIDGGGLLVPTAGDSSGNTELDRILDLATQLVDQGVAENPCLKAFDGRRQALETSINDSLK